MVLLGFIKMASYAFRYFLMLPNNTQYSFLRFRWSGITAVTGTFIPSSQGIQLLTLCRSTAYSPILLAQAGYSSTTQAGLAGGINTIGIIGTSSSSSSFSHRNRP